VFQLGFVEIDPDGRTITAYNGVAAVVAAPARSQGMLAIQVPPGAAESVIARDIVHVAVMDGVKGTTLAYRPTDTGKSFKTIGNTRNASTDAFHRPDNRDPNRCWFRELVLQEQAREATTSTRARPTRR